MPSKGGQLRLVKLLLEYKADPNAQQPYGWPALMTACQRNNEQVVRMLLAHGAKPNMQNQYGDTAIILAANTDRVQMVADLIKAGADMNGGSGQTALMIAAQCGSNKSIKLLLKNGANPNFHRAGQLTALEYSTQSYDPETYSLLKKAGAKGRPKSQLANDMATLSKEWEAEYKSKTDAFAAKNAEFAKLLPEDQALIEAAIGDMATFKGDIEFSRVDGKDVVLYDSTIAEASGDEEREMNGELDGPKAADIDIPMRRDLLRRNCKEVSLSGFKFTNPLILLVNEATDKTNYFGRYGVPGKAKGWVKVMLPGYSEDGSRAVLRFFDGPSSHGATGTYLLVKKDRFWKVKWRQFTQYV